MTNDQEPGNLSHPSLGAPAAMDAVLALAVCGSPGAAIDLLGALCELFPHYTPLMVRRWCDAYIDHSTGGAPSWRGGTFTFVDVSTGAQSATRPKDMPDDEWWAARMIRARIDRDEAAYADTWNECAALSDEELGTRVVTLLRCVALSIQGTPRGYAKVKEALPWNSMN